MSENSIAKMLKGIGAGFIVVGIIIFIISKTTFENDYRNYGNNNKSKDFLNFIESQRASDFLSWLDSSGVYIHYLTLNNLFT